MRRGAASRHSSASCSTDPSWRAYTNSTSGRSTASSVMGTGLLAQAPYTIADETRTRCWALTASVSAAVTPSVALCRRRARASASAEANQTITVLSPMRPSMRSALLLSRCSTRRPSPSEPSLTHTVVVAEVVVEATVMATDASAGVGRRLAFMADGPESDNPFENLPMFGDLARALSVGGPSTGARHGSLPAGRNRWCRRGQHRPRRSYQTRRAGADRRAACATSPSTALTRDRPRYRRRMGEQDARGVPTTVHRAGRIARQADDTVGVRELDLNADPMMAMMANLSKMMAPSMMGMAVGSMVGR